MKPILVGLAILAAALGSAQVGSGAGLQGGGQGTGGQGRSGGGNTGAPVRYGEPVKIVVRHADPWMIKLALEGQPLVSPELSTVWALMGVPPPAAQAANSLISGGKLVVNPTDNSLWFFPEIK